MTTVEFLEHMKTRLLKTGWVKGYGGGEHGPNCLLGAAYWESENATERDWEYSDVEIAGLNILASLLTCNCDFPNKEYATMSITHWNDHATRTFGEVVAALDNAIIRAKELEAQHG